MSVDQPPLSLLTWGVAAHCLPALSAAVHSLEVAAGQRLELQPPPETASEFAQVFQAEVAEMRRMLQVCRDCCATSCRHPFGALPIWRVGAGAGYGSLQRDVEHR